MAAESTFRSADQAVVGKSREFWFKRSLCVLVVLTLVGIVFAPLPPSSIRALEAGYHTSIIAHYLSEYSKKHEGHYPEGKSSTEVFQKLLDEGVCNDPTVFFRPGLPGKIIPEIIENYKLKPENVCYDITIPVDDNSPNDLPLVFLTGYKITYHPSASAVPLSASVSDRIPLMAVDYKGKTFAFFRRWSWQSAYYRTPGGYQDMYYLPDAKKGKLGGKILADGTITEFIPSSFTSKGERFIQLTPDGPLDDH